MCGVMFDVHVPSDNHYSFVIINTIVNWLVIKYIYYNIFYNLSLCFQHFNFNVEYKRVSRVLLHGGLEYSN